MAASKPAPAQLPLPDLGGAEKVAILLLALGRTRATQLLKKFDADDLKLITRAAVEVKPVGGSDLEVLVEEFAQTYTTGLKFGGTMKEVETLLSGVMTSEQIAEAMSDPPPVEAAPVAAAWGELAKVKEEVLRAYLLKEHPQTVALILSKMDSGSAAKLLAAFPPNLRSGLLCRMLNLKPVGDAVLQVIDEVLRRDLMTVEVRSHASIADILNKLEKSESDDLLRMLADQRPDDAKALKDMLFSFEDLSALPVKSRATVFDQVPIERVVLALKGTDAAFQSSVLATLGARARRMVEVELQGGSTASARDIAEARRGIVDTVLRMIASGEIERYASDDAQQAG